MNYKVMKRPMFKLGGKAASQGTGITSGLDEKVNMTEGRVNYQTGPMIGGMTQQQFLDASPQELNLALLGMNKEGLANLDKSRDLVRLQALSNLATNVLPNIESGGFTAVTDFLKDPMTTQTAVKGLTGLKQIELAKQKADRERLSNLIANQMQFKIGERGFDTTGYFDGYLSQVNFINGTDLTASSFAETKEGVWIPKNTSGLTFGGVKG